MNCEHVDRNLLYTDRMYRFNYVCRYAGTCTCGDLMARVGFDAQDLESIRTSAPLMGPQVPWIVDQVYLRMFSFDITKKTFLKRNVGYQGPTVTSLKDLTLDNAQIKFRKDFLRRYLLKLMLADYDDKFVRYLEFVGKIHTDYSGKKSKINVDYMHCNALFAHLTALLIDCVHKCGLDAEDTRKASIAYNKIMWIQNDMFSRWYVRDGVDTDHEDDTSEYDAATVYNETRYSGTDSTGGAYSRAFMEYEHERGHYEHDLWKKELIGWSRLVAASLVGGLILKFVFKLR